MNQRLVERDACFVCSSPYQIIGAISIVKNEKMNADLYITSEFPGYDNIASKLRNYNLFSSVYVIDSPIFRKRGALASIQITVFSEHTISKYMPKDVSYKYYFASSRSTLKAAQLSVLRRRNPNIKRVLFEDGLGSYSDSGRLLSNVSKQRKIIEKVLRWDLDDPQKMCLMVYLPELLSMPEQWKDIPVEKMPRLEMTPENQALLADVFSINQDDYISESHIIFDVKRRGGKLDLLSTDEKAILDKCYDIVVKAFNDEVICKPHPKSLEVSNCAIKVYQNQGIPMEVLYHIMNDLESRVLIAYVSTAIFTPKILFDKEPIVICLHNFFPDNEISKNFVSIYEKFRSTYRQQERVIAPSSLDDLASVINKLSIGELLI